MQYRICFVFNIFHSYRVILERFSPEAFQILRLSLNSHYGNLHLRPDERKNYHALAFILNTPLYEGFQSSLLEIVRHTAGHEGSCLFQIINPFLVRHFLYISANTISAQSCQKPVYKTTGKGNTDTFGIPVEKIAHSEPKSYGNIYLPLSSSRKILLYSSLQK